MKVRLCLFVILLTISLSPIFSQEESNGTKKIKIKWVNNLKGDFSFKEQWSYPEGVYKNQYGQISCDGFTSDETAKMIDSSGRIYKDSLNAFYQLVDTTHLYHTIKSEAWCYEWTGTDFIEVKRVSENKVLAKTINNAATHSSLILEIGKDSCSSRIELNSITQSGKKTFYIKRGRIKIDKQYWKKGILKAKFDFIFDNTTEPAKQMFWKSKIFCRIIE